MVVLSRERYERIKGIVRIKCKGIVRKRTNKKLSAKNEKIPPLRDKRINSPYKPSNMIYTRKSELWSWIRVNEWFRELKDYYNVAR